MDPIAAEKRTAMLRYTRLRKITTLLRCVEALTLTVVALWSSSHIPAAARSSGDLLLRLLPILLGPRFLFLLGNAIVIILLFKSRHLTSTTADVSIGDEISAFVAPPPAEAPAEPVVFEDKRVLCVESPPRAAAQRSCRRSRSERVGDRRRGSAELLRAETDVGKVKEEEDPEEFRRTIEAFIKKQWKFQREESMAIVSADGSDALTCSGGTAVQVKEII